MYGGVRGRVCGQLGLGQLEVAWQAEKAKLAQQLDVMRKEAWFAESCSHGWRIFLVGDGGACGIALLPIFEADSKVSKLKAALESEQACFGIFGPLTT